MYVRKLQISGHWFIIHHVHVSTHHAEANCEGSRPCHYIHVHTWEHDTVVPLLKDTL